MNRMDVLRLVDELGADLPVVATCAATSRELAAVADRPNHFFLLDSMGLTTSVGTGIALAIEDSPVARTLVLDGDGSLLMNLGALATAGYLLPPKLVVVLLDNGVYASTADLPTHANRLDLGAIAGACGLRILRADNADEVSRSLKQTMAEPGPWLLHTRIEPGNTAGTPLLLADPVVLADRFRVWLTGRMREDDG